MRVGERARERKRQRFRDSEKEREERGEREGKRMDITCHLTQRSRVCKKVKYVESGVCERVRACVFVCDLFEQRALAQKSGTQISAEVEGFSRRASRL